MIDVNWTHCGDHFTLCTNIASLRCTSETNMLHVNYTLIKNKKTISVSIKKYD